MPDNLTSSHGCTSRARRARFVRLTYCCLVPALVPRCCQRRRSPQERAVGRLTSGPPTPLAGAWPARQARV
jgi:hypothetical protein